MPSKGCAQIDLHVKGLDWKEHLSFRNLPGLRNPYSITRKQPGKKQAVVECGALSPHAGMPWPLRFAMVYRGLECRIWFELLHTWKRSLRLFLDHSSVRKLPTTKTESQWWTRTGSSGKLGVPRVEFGEEIRWKRLGWPVLLIRGSRTWEAIWKCFFGNCCVVLLVRLVSSIRPVAHAMAPLLWRAIKTSNRWVSCRKCNGEPASRKDVNMKWHKSVVIVLFALVVVTKVGIGWAVEQDQSGQPGPGVPRMMCQDRFDAMDTNHDGVVTRDEFMAVRHPGGRGQEVFKSRDTNGDGVLTRDEFCAGKGMGKGRRPW